MPANTVALTLGHHGDGADEHQRHCAAIIAAEQHRPQLDRAEQRAILDRGKAGADKRRHTIAEAIGRAAVTIGTKGAIEQLLHRLFPDLFKPDQFDHQHPPAPT